MRLTPILSNLSGTGKYPKTTESLLNTLDKIKFRKK